MTNSITAIVTAALAPLVAIADAYDANALDDDARKFWGRNYENENTTPHGDIELCCTKGGGRLLTLADAMVAREATRTGTNLTESLAPLVRIVDAFKRDSLGEARSNTDHSHEDIELYQGRGGRQLLTLAHCFAAQEALFQSCFAKDI